MHGMLYTEHDAFNVVCMYSPYIYNIMVLWWNFFIGWRWYGRSWAWWVWIWIWGWSKWRSRTCTGKFGALFNVCSDNTCTKQHAVVVEILMFISEVSFCVLRTMLFWLCLIFLTKAVFFNITYPSFYLEVYKFKGFTDILSTRESQSFSMW